METGIQKGSPRQRERVMVKKMGSCSETWKDWSWVRLMDFCWEILKETQKDSRSEKPMQKDSGWVIPKGLH